ncbi:MAG: nitronate monooxygenase family protein [bacterium]
MNTFLKPLIIGDLEIKVPIIQGGMGVKISTADLASAVAQCGAAGTISGVGLGYGTPENETNFVKASRDGLIREIRKVKNITKGPVGVNLMVAASNFDDLAQTACAEKIDFIAAGAGLPLHLPKFDSKRAIKLIPIVSSARAADLIIKAWKKRYNRLPDAIIVEGPLAGGHLGFKNIELHGLKRNQLEKILNDVLVLGKELNIPVIPAGGIYDGKDIARYLLMGASGVQMATRFVTTHECSVSPNVKNLYIKATKEDLIIIDSPVGMPGRAIKTKLIERILNHEKIMFTCHYHCLRTCDPEKTLYCIAESMFNATIGDVDNAVVFAGQNVTRVKKIISVKELIESLVKQTLRYLNKKTTIKC